MTRVPAVPRPVASVIGWLAPADSRDSILADLDEEAAARAARDGVPAARRWCWRQLAGSFLPLASLRGGRCVADLRSHAMLLIRRLPSDFGLALRRLRHSPGFTAICLLTLALGIGATTAVFTLVDRVMLQDLPVSRPAELYRLGDGDNCCVNSGLQGTFSLFSYDLYRHLRDNLSEMSDLAAFQAHVIAVNARRSGEVAARPLAAQLVSGNYFQMFGVSAAAGRTLLPADDAPGARVVGVLSYRAWQQRFAGDPSAIGAPLTVNGVPLTIVGVTPPAFYGDMVRPEPPEIWLPIAIEPLVQPAARLIATPSSHWLYAIGRIEPGATPAPIAAHASTLLRQWLAASSILSAADRTRIPEQQIRVVSAARGVDNLRQQVAPGLRLLLAISAAVLLIVCANLANLFLARGLGRRAELAVRSALGAPRGRLLVEPVLESIVLACVGGVAGLAVAFAGARGIVAIVFNGAANVPLDPTPSLVVVAFATAVSVAVGFTIGVIPAWLSSRADPIDAMRGAGRVAGPRGSRLRQWLVIVQVALSLALVASAGLLTRSLFNLQRQDFGFRTDGRYVVALNTALGKVSADRLAAIYRALPDRLRRIPGVGSAAFSLYSPMEGDNWSSRLTVEGRTPSDTLLASWNRVSPDYFETIGTPLIRGRVLDARDTPASAPVAVVSETFARRFFGEADPLGRHFGFADKEGGGAQPFEIVGIVGDAKYQEARLAPYAMFFLPFLQEAGGSASPGRLVNDRSNFARRLELRLAAPAVNLEAEVRAALAEVDPGFTVMRVMSLDRQVAGNFSGERLVAALTAGFGAMALLLACLGLYGVTAQAVTARTREIGVRVAVGASRGRIVGTVLRAALLQVGAGFVLGAAAALAAGRVLEQQLYGVSGRDPLVLTGSALVLGCCAVVAAAVPSWRAANIDPVRALRAD